MNIPIDIEDRQHQEGGKTTAYSLTLRFYGEVTIWPKGTWMFLTAKIAYFAHDYRQRYLEDQKELNMDCAQRSEN